MLYRNYPLNIQTFLTEHFLFFQVAIDIITDATDEYDDRKLSIA